MIVDEPLALSSGLSVNVLPSIITDSNKSEFDVLAVKVTSSPSTSLALNVTTISSPSSKAESGFSIVDNTGASFTFSTTTSNVTSSDERPPSLTETVTVPVPTWFSPGSIVNVEPEIPTSNKSLEVLALNVKSVSPSISVAFNPTVVGVSSKAETSDIDTIEGASLTATTVTSKAADAEASPSSTETVIVVLPLKLASGAKSTKYPEAFNEAATFSFVDETATVNGSKS